MKNHDRNILIALIAGTAAVHLIFRRNEHIGEIVENKPVKAKWQCRDGTFSTSSGTGACSYHGGIEKEATIVICANGEGSGSKLEIVDLPIKQVHVNHEWFQNRAAPFSVRSVENIINAVDVGDFRWENFDPITIWKNEQGKYYILSGHSRTEAFRRLCEEQAKSKGRTFCKIPAKIVHGISLEEAKKIASESNTLSTPETDLERAVYYRNLRTSGQINPKDIRESIKRTEGRNANTILALSYLSPAGRTWNALKALENSNDTSKGNMANIARWIGNARIRFEQLTDSHENEIYDWLVQNKGYGTSKNQLSSERDFLDRLYSIINRKTEWGEFKQNEPLNILRLLSKSPVEAEYDEQVEAAKANIKSLEKELREKTTDLARRGGSEEQIRNATLGIETSLRRARLDFQRLLNNKGEVLKQARNQQSLF